MRCIISSLAVGIALLFLHINAIAADYVPDNYIWTSQSENSSESMPCGGHDVGMNVWVENGDILFYVSHSGMFDENNTLLKAGRFRITLSPNPFEKGRNDFQQILCLDDGAVYIKSNTAEICLWADVFTSAVYAEIISKEKVDATLSYESWRYKDRPVTKDECQQCSYKWVLPNDCTTYQDSIQTNSNKLTFWHKNREKTVFDFTVSREHLDSIKSELYNPIGGLRFGGVMYAPDFSFMSTTDGFYTSTDYRSWNFKAQGIKKSTITISLYNGDTAPAIPSAKESRKRSAQWWHAYWQRSYIIADGEAKNIARNYELFRYMLGCNAYGEWPTKFNGGLFTFDPIYVDKSTPFTPDYRRWGGGTMTAQNQRLVYWGMLKSGDIDMMVAQFDTYLRMLPAAVKRTQYYWGHDGASFTEQIENFGLPNPAEYGKHAEGSDYGTERNAWLEYLWDTSLEFCSMILYAHEYTEIDITKYEPLIRQCLLFFDEHYQYLAKQRGSKALNEAGKLILYPSSGCETYKMAYNPSSTIAALKTVLEQCERYDASLNRIKEDSTGFNYDDCIIDYSMKNRIPDIPIQVISGDSCIAPAIVWERIQNVESPQLYPVFPWRIFGIGRPDLNIARNTYINDPHVVEMRSSKGWKQDNIWAACLGITVEAKQLTTEKFADGPFRFPAFWEQGFDWAPDCNRGGSAMIGFQEMLLQEAPDGSLLFFPAWPKEWNASFRLNATDGRVVEGEIKASKISYVVKKDGKVIEKRNE
ncbi:MAG: DUF5703 domain-containing protein [Prevotella sp.]|nr:DUF5703 domain-containing protein [Prevotella sp.]